MHWIRIFIVFLWYIIYLLIKWPEHGYGCGGGEDQHIWNRKSTRKPRLFSDFAKNAVCLSIQIMC